ncbi:hypothetical protein DFH06DRAFT_1349428 [Mycena polygramma]|nr:hypothetical protein DFH06DRAFT_1349428 [Mycena polygramma]
MFRRRTLVESAARWPGAREGALFQPRVTEKEGKELGTEEGSAVVKMGRNAGSRAVCSSWQATLVFALICIVLQAPLMAIPHRAGSWLSRPRTTAPRLLLRVQDLTGLTADGAAAGARRGLLRS